MQKARKPIEIKISTVVAISAILHETDPTSLESALKEMTGGVADFFEDEFAVLDIGSLDAEAAAGIDWSAVVALFKRFRLNTVAVRNAPEQLHAGIVGHGLAIDTSRCPAPVRPMPAPRRPPRNPWLPPHRLPRLSLLHRHPPPPHRPPRLKRPPPPRPVPW